MQSSPEDKQFIETAIARVERDDSCVETLDLQVCGRRDRGRKNP